MDAYNVYKASTMIVKLMAPGSEDKALRRSEMAIQVKMY